MPSAHSVTSPPPRVLLVMPEQWPRALLRAALREAGYDALGATGLAAALRYRTESPDRGLVRLILVDQAALKDEESATLLDVLVRRHEDPAAVLLARAMPARPLPAAAAPAPWRRVIRRPASIADLVAAVQALLPLPPGSSGRPIE
jgi:DNA-binding response OmpR family regulator